jgi:hypothetical protein
MDNLRTILDNLDDLSESYVWERAKDLNGKTDAILKEVGVSTSKFYATYSKEERANLDDIARQIYRNTQFRALKALDEVAEKAAKKLQFLMMSAEDEKTQLQAAKYILDQTIGTPTKRVDVTSGGESVKVVVRTGMDSDEL